MTSISDSAGMDISAAGDIPVAQQSKHRAVALDMLRGLAILMMVFSSCIRFDKPLPSWLFHAQEPTTFDQNGLVVHIFNPAHAGLTFVDLVFPTFLFALGAAIPLALTKKIEEGVSKSRILVGGLQRLAQLSWFALYIGNIRPNMLHDKPDTMTWLIALLGYALMYPMFTRLPEDWSEWQRLGVRVAGYGGGALLLAWLTINHYYPKHLGFDLWRVDVIIVALGDMAFFGTAIWLLTRVDLGQRLGFLAVLLAIRLGASQQGWLHDIWTFAPKNTGWLFAFDYLKYLFLVIPGTIAGDMVHKWVSNGDFNPTRSNWPRLLSFVTVAALLVIGVLTGMETRKLWETAAFCGVLTLFGTWLLSNPRDSLQQLAQSLTRWGSYWLILGILLEPFEGGIKKDPSTLSYYFVTAGLAYFMLAALLILTGTFKLQKPLALLGYAGQNPMIAYVSMGNFILPLFALVGLQPILDRVFVLPWMGVLLAALETLLLAIFVGILSKKKIFWRT